MSEPSAAANVKVVCSMTTMIPELDRTPARHRWSLSVQVESSGRGSRTSQISASLQSAQAISNVGRQAAI
jgi:hypothetical protein